MRILSVILALSLSNVAFGSLVETKESKIPSVMMCSSHKLTLNKEIVEVNCNVVCKVTVRETVKERITKN